LLVGRPAEKVISVDAQTPDGSSVANECSFTLKDLLRIKCWK